MHRPYRQRITILSSLCLLLFGVGFAAMSTLPSPVGAALQGASSTPFFTPALKSTLIPLDDFQSSAGFGSAVSTSHGIILVGAPHAYSNQGTAYIFDQPTPDNWQQTAELVAPDGDPGDLFGSAVSIDTGATGMVAVVGAPGDDAAGLDAGAVYVYMLNGQNHWTLTARINAPDAAPGDQFGYAVGYSDGTIIIGAPYANAGGYSDIGAVYVFTGDQADWGLQQKLDYALMYPPSSTLRTNNQHFGYAVDMYGNQAIVSSVPSSDIANFVHVFSRVFGAWYIQGVAVSPTYGIGFGRSVAIYHDTAVVGAPLYDDPIFGVDSGRIYVYIWNPITGLVLQPDGDYTHFGAGHQGGSSVDLYRGDAAAGAPYATIDPGSGAKGSVLAFDPHGWLVRNTAITDGAQFGASVGFWNGDLAVGAPGDDYYGLTDPGAVYVYRLLLPPWEAATATPLGFMPTTTLRVPSLTPSSMPTSGPTSTATPSRTPTAFPYSPPNATPGPYYFRVHYPTLTWSPISWAQGYQIQIDDDPNFGSPISVPDEFSSNTFSYTVSTNLANGTYYWRVRAKKNTTDWGNWSARETIIVSAP